MLKHLGTVLLLGATLMNTGKALATELSNEDSKTYKLKIIEGSTTTNTSINGNTTRMSVCSGKCTIEIVDGASIDATNAATVKIKNGKLEVK